MTTLQNEPNRRKPVRELVLNEQYSIFTPVSQFLAKFDHLSLRNKIIFVICCVVSIIVLWLHMTPVREFAITQGKFVLNNKNPVISHIIGGVVDDVYITEGQSVEKGEPLLKLNVTYYIAELLVLEEQKQQVLGKIQQYTKEIPKPTRATQPNNESLKQHLHSVQLALHSSRSTAKNIMNGLDASKNVALESLHQQLNEILDDIDELNNIIQKSNVYSPSSGIAKNISVAQGGIIAPGQPLLEVIPHNKVLYVQTDINMNNLRKVKVGDLVNVRLAVNNESRNRVLKGIIKSISANNQGIIEINSQIPSTQISQSKLMPGIPVVANIAVGKRSMLQQLTENYGDKFNVAAKSFYNNLAQVTQSKKDHTAVKIAGI